MRETFKTLNNSNRLFYREVSWTQTAEEEASCQSYNINVQSVRSSSETTHSDVVEARITSRDGHHVVLASTINRRGNLLTVPVEHVQVGIHHADRFQIDAVCSSSSCRE